jgi:hypothetical protein
MAPFAGIRTTDLTSTSFAMLKRSVYDALFDFKPYQTPVAQFYLANKRNKIAVANPKYETVEDTLIPYTATVSSVAASGSAQTLTLDANGLAFPVGSIVRFDNTNENAYVSTCTSATEIAVRALNNSTALTAITTSSTMRHVGFASAEGGASPVAASTVATQPYNYTQILKRAIHVSGTQMASTMYGMASDWVHQRMKVTEEIKLDIERMSVFGIRAILTTAGAHIRYNGGFLDDVATNTDGMGISDHSHYTGDSFSDEGFFFNTYCKNLFAKGSNEKVLYCGADALLGINDFSKVKQQTKVSEKEYGVDIQVILTPFGRLKLVWHPLLEGEYANWAIGIDRDDYLKYAYLSGNGVNRDLTWEDNIQVADEDERKAQYKAECGMWMAGGFQGVHRILRPE